MTYRHNVVSPKSTIVGCALLLFAACSDSKGTTAGGKGGQSGTGGISTGGSNGSGGTTSSSSGGAAGSSKTGGTTGSGGNAGVTGSSSGGAAGSSKTGGNTGSGQGGTTAIGGGGQTAGTGGNVAGASGNSDAGVASGGAAGGPPVEPPGPDLVAHPVGQVAKPAAPGPPVRPAAQASMLAPSPALALARHSPRPIPPSLDLSRPPARRMSGPRRDTPPIPSTATNNRNSTSIVRRTLQTDTATPSWFGRTVTGTIPNRMVRVLSTKPPTSGVDSTSQCSTISPRTGSS